jgi:predicted nucleic acid-binding protein
MAFVVDSSVTLAWLLPDEQYAGLDALADALETGPAQAPPLWALEVRNALVTAQRRKRITERELDKLLKIIDGLPIELDTAPPVETGPAVVACARRFGLTTYDAAYLELAQRLGLPLATIDVALADAARKAGVTVLP